MKSPETTAIPKAAPTAALRTPAPPSGGAAAAARSFLAAAGAAVSAGAVYVLSIERVPGSPPPDALFPFTYATIIGLGLLGLAAALLAGRRWRAAFILGLFVAVAGAAGTAVEWLAIDLGTDRLFGFGAALGLTAAGAAATFLAAGPAFGGAAGAAAATLLVLASAGLAAQAFGLPAGAAFAWTHLAPAPAAGFAVLGAGFMVFAGYRPNGLAYRRVQWLPEIEALAALIFTVVVWQALRAGEWLALDAQLAAQGARPPSAWPRPPFSTVGFYLGLVFCALVYETSLLARRLRSRGAQLLALRLELAQEAARRADAERRHEEKKRLLQNTSATLAGREESLGLALAEVTESRDRLRALASIVESSEDGIIGKNAQGIVTSWNTGAEKIYGYKREEMLGKSITLLAPPGHAQEAHDLIRRVFRGETIKNFEAVRLSKDGRRIEVSLGISPIRDAAGAVTAASVVARDITDKKRAEESLRRNEALIREVLESLPVGLSIADETGAIVTQNQKMRELWSDRGIAQGSPERKGWWADTGRPLAAGDWPLARAVAQGEPSVANLIEIEGADGVRKTFTFNAVPLRDAQGRIVGAIEVQEDVTERRRAEQALALHSVILRNMKEGVCLIRASDAVIVYTNPKFEEMYGYAPGELMGLEANVLNHAGTAESHSKTWRRITDALMQGGEAVYELHSQKKDGTPFWCAARTSEFTHPTFGKVWVAVQENITEKKNAETRLRQSLQEKEVLLQEVHHRVKNNMQIISSLLQLQSQHIKDPRVLKVVQESRRRIRSMALIHEKLYRSGDVARVQFGDYVKSLVADVVRSFNTGGRAPDVKLDIVPVDLDLDTAIPLGLLVNELVSNAVKHAFPNKNSGEILVELKSATPETLSLRVKDDGVGFVEAAPVQGEENAPFGLRLVHILSEQLGGKAEITSGPGVEFRVTFPLGAKSALHKEPQTPKKV